MISDRFPFDASVAAWTEGVRSFWPGATPTEIDQLLRVRDALSSTAPEERGILIGQAWKVYCEAGDDGPIGRAAVLLARIIDAGDR